MSEVCIIDFFNEDSITEKSDGNYKTICPSCGLQGGRTEGMILFPETNSWYCHSSGKHGGIIDLVALKFKLIGCIDCLETDEKRSVLSGDLFKQTLDILQENYSEEVYEGVLKIVGCESYNVRKYLIEKFNKKGELVSSSVDVDKVAYYLIKKFQIKTIFGIKEESLYVYTDGLWSRTGKGILISSIERLLGVYAKNNSVKEILDKVKRKTESNREEFETVPEFMTPLLNGVLDLSDINDIKFLPHDKKYNFKKIFPVEYNPKARCPKNIKFIRETFYESDIQQFQEYGGLHLIRRYLFKKAAIMQGKKDTGKTVVVNILKSFCGNGNVSGLSLQKISQGKSFDLLFLKDSFANIFDDLSAQDLSDSGGFKMSVGDGDITGEQKFGDQIRFRNTAKQTHTCNKFPSLKNLDDDAYYDRLLIWHLGNVVNIEKRNPKLIDELTTKKEFSGLLNWFIEGYVRLIKQNKFSNEKTCEEIKELMTSNSNILAKFSNVILEYSPGSKLTKEQLYESYCIFCSKQDTPTAPESKIKIGNSLTRFASYILDSKSGGERYWLNVKLRDDWDTFLKTYRGEFESNSDSNINNIIFQKSSHSPQSQREIKIRKPLSVVAKLPPQKTTPHVSKPKSDREIQFWEAEECKGIIPNHTKEDILKWWKDNPKTDYKEMYYKFGVGSIKFWNELKHEGLL